MKLMTHLVKAILQLNTLLLVLYPRQRGRSYDALRTMGVPGRCRRNAVDELLLRLREDAPAGPRMAELALRWIFGMPVGAGQMCPNRNDDASMLELVGQPISSLLQIKSLILSLVVTASVERVMQVPSCPAARKTTHLSWAIPALKRLPLLRAWFSLSSGNVPDILRGKHLDA